MLDLAIIGSGPAALTAAIYASRANLSVKVFERAKLGGALAEIAQIDNFPGFMGAGQDLAKNILDQAQKSGAIIEYGECEQVAPKGNHFELIIDGETITARSVLVATGSEPRPLEVATKTPISYCALCDAPLYAGKNIAVIGGGNSAIQESIHLAKVVESLTVINRSTLRAEPSIIERLKSCQNVKILENTEVTTEMLDSFDGIFVFIGKRPAAAFLPAELLDENGYIKAEDYMSSTPGLFAAGDVRATSVKQAVTAAAEGAIAATKIIAFLNQ